MLSEKVDRKKKIMHIYRAPIDNTESSNNGDEINSRIEKKVDSIGKKVDSLCKKVDSLGKKIDNLGEKIDDLGKKIDGGFLNLQNFFVKLFAEYFGKRKKIIIENDDIGEKGQENYSADYEGKKNGLEQISLSSESHKSEQQKGKVLKKAEFYAPKASRGKLSSRHVGKIEISGNEQQKGMVLKKAELDAPKASRRNLSSRHDGKIEISGHYYGKNDTIPSIRRRYIGKNNCK